MSELNNKLDIFSEEAVVVNKAAKEVSKRLRKDLVPVFNLAIKAMSQMRYCMEPLLLSSLRTRLIKDIKIIKMMREENVQAK